MWCDNGAMILRKADTENEGKRNSVRKNNEMLLED